MDVTTGTELLFGGDMGPGRLGDTWKWDGDNWMQLQPAISPSARSHHAMAARSNGDILLFGGVDLNGTYLNETWLWKGFVWTDVSPPSSPGARTWHSMVYDQARDRIVLFGGFTPPDTYYGDTWEWDGSAWQLVSTGGPTERAHHAMAYDPVRQEVVMFGGHRNGPRFGDTWVWNGTTWRAATPAASPSVRGGPVMAFDEEAEEVVLYGGWEGVPLFDAWAWDGNTWSLLTQTNPVTLDANTGLVPAPTSRGLLYFGDDDNGLGQTWRLQLTYSASGEPFGTSCPGSSGTPRLVVEPGERPWVGESFVQRLVDLPQSQLSVPFGVLGFSDSSDGLGTLPRDLTVIGMTGCSQFVSFDLVFTLVNVAGSADWTIRVPNNPVFAGVTFFTQGFVMDQAANPLGLTATNGARWVTGSR